MPTCSSSSSNRSVPTGARDGPSSKNVANAVLAGSASEVAWTSSALAHVARKQTRFTSHLRGSDASGRWTVSLAVLQSDPDSNAKAQRRKGAKRK